MKKTSIGCEKNLTIIIYKVMAAVSDINDENSTFGQY